MSLRCSRIMALTDNIQVSSFNPINFPRFHRQLPEVPLGMLTFPGKARFFAYGLFRYDALNPYLNRCG